tara:strand:+ start:538 stop:696 length:159 start_codon:yes stop_codon:yes gene_type:complete
LKQLLEQVDTVEAKIKKKRAILETLGYHMDAMLAVQSLWVRCLKRMQAGQAE